MEIKFNKPYSYAFNGIHVTKWGAGDTADVSDILGAHLVAVGIAEDTHTESVHVKTIGELKEAVKAPSPMGSDTDALADLEKLTGVGPKLAALLVAADISCLEDISFLEIGSDLYEALLEIDGVSDRRLKAWILEADDLIGEGN